MFVLLTSSWASGPSAPARSRHHIAHLRVDASRRYGHDHRLHGSQLALCYALFLGHAKVVLHSGIAAQCHGGGQMEHQRGLWLQNLGVPCRVVELVVCSLLIAGYQRSLLSLTSRSSLCVIRVLQDLEELKAMSHRMHYSMLQ